MPPLDDIFDDGGDDDCFFTSVDDYIKHIEDRFHFGFNTSLIDTMMDDFSHNFGNDAHTSSTSLPIGLSIFEDHMDEFDGELLFEEDDENINSHEPRERLPNEFGYAFGNVWTSSWYVKFLAPDVRERTYRCSSRDRFGPFRSHFRFPLHKVDDLTHKFILNDWVTFTHRIQSSDELFLRTQLQIMACLNVLGSYTPFRQLETPTNISREHHRLFFHLFLEKMCSVRDDYIKYPKTQDNGRAVSNY